jgi:hypothetical protein
MGGLMRAKLACLFGLLILVSAITIGCGEDNDPVAPQVGAITINPEPNSIVAPWQITGPNAFSQSGTGDATLGDMTAGSYALTWGSVTGWTTPSPAAVTQTLVANGTLTYAGLYVEESGYALEFDGVDDRVEVSDEVNVTGPLTVEAWIRADEWRGRIADCTGYMLDVYGGQLRFATDNYVRAQADISAYLGEWVHVAATWEGPSGGGIVLYVNGAAVNVSSFTGVMTWPAFPLIIGSDGGPNPFHGAIDEVRVFDAALAGSVIRDWKNRRIGPEHPDYAHLQGAWSFEVGAGQIVIGAVPGRDGQLGAEAGVDAADPTWITSGMGARSLRAWRE